MRNEENTCQYCTRQSAIATLLLNAYLNKMCQDLSDLLIVSGLLKNNSRKKTASTNFTWLRFVFPDSFVFPYFNLNIL